MRKRRGSLAKAGTVFLALLVALVLTGMGYGVWTDTLGISGTVNTGSLGSQVSGVACYTSGTETDGKIGCIAVGTDVLQLTVTNAHYGITYTCLFNIANTESIPLKIQEIEVSPVTPPTLPEGVVIDVAYVEPGDQIEPGGALGGVVKVELANDTSQGQTFTFTVEFTVVYWNQYVP